MTMKANSLSEHRSKCIVLKRWDYPQRTPISIPLEAILDENSIKVRFLDIILQDVILTPKKVQLLHLYLLR